VARSVEDTLAELQRTKSCVSFVANVVSVPLRFCLQANPRTALHARWWRMVGFVPANPNPHASSCWE
jgi:hypothetical protein